MGERRSKNGQDLMDAPASRVPQVMIVSPVLLYREGLAASIAADGRLRAICITDPLHALSEVRIRDPQALLVDVTTPESLAMARHFKSQVEDIVVVGFGISNSPAAAIACAEAGLAGFVDENGSIDALVKTTLSALRGEFCCSPRIAALLCDRLASLANRTQSQGHAVTLTPREREIASLVSRGLSNKEIAIDLRIGPATVKNHVHNILDKLKVKRRAAIAGQIVETAP